MKIIIWNIARGEQSRTCVYRGLQLFRFNGMQRFGYYTGASIEEEEEDIYVRDAKRWDRLAFTNQSQVLLSREF